MRWTIAAVISVLLVATSAWSVRPTPVDVDTTIDRGLSFLASDALAWRNDHHCVSCHHAGLVVWSMHEARQFGHTVNEPVLTELTKWIAESGDGKTSAPRPVGIPKALNTQAVWYALALEADPSPDTTVQKGLKLLLSTVKADQTESGAWSSWPATRPPLSVNSDESVTALGTLAVLPVAASGDAEMTRVRDKGVTWMTRTKTDDEPQSIALRLILWKRLGRPSAEWEPLARRIRAEQNADGGWSQARGMTSDAWATGQALYALSYAGIKSNASAISRGQIFLTGTQRADGSWPMTSRPMKPGGTGAANLSPITIAGSAWAILGLVRTTALTQPSATPSPGK